MILTDNVYRFPPFEPVRNLNHACPFASFLSFFLLVLTYVSPAFVQTTYAVPSSFPSTSTSDTSPSTSTRRSQNIASSTFIPESGPASVLIAGCAAVDVISKFSPGISGDIASRTTAPGMASLTLGGVGRNVAEACHRVLNGAGQGGSALLIAPVGNDAFGRLVKEEMRDMKMRVDGLFIAAYSAQNGLALEKSSTSDPSARTAVCNMVLDAQGDLIGGVADMGIVEAGLTGKAVIEQITKTKPRVVCLDGNLSEKAITDLVQYCRRADPTITLFFEPTSGPKSTRILPALHAYSSTLLTRAPIDFISPNILELQSIYQAARATEVTDLPGWWETIESFKLGDRWRNEVELLSRLAVHPPSGTSAPGERKLDWLVKQGVVQMAVNLLPFFQHILIKCGQDGVVAIFRTSSLSWSTERTNLATHSRQVVSHYSLSPSVQGSIVLRHFPPLWVEAKDIVNVTGAGDSFVGTVLAELAERKDGLNSPEVLEEVVGRGQRAAVMSLGAETSVSPALGGGW